MTAAVGDILNWLAAGVMFPLLMLPLASLASGTRRSAAIWIAIVGAVITLSWVFASLAVDLNPPKFSPGLMIALSGGVISIGALIATKGAAALAEKIAGPVEKIVILTGRASLYLVMAMALVQFATVILRYVFGLNFIAMQESVTYMHGAVFLLAGGYAFLTDDHVRVDIFYRDAGPYQKAAVNLAGTYLLLFPFCFVALWATGPYVANSWAVHEGSMEQSGIRGVFLLKSLIAVYLTLLAMAGFVIAARAAATLKMRSA